MIKKSLCWRFLESYVLLHVLDRMSQLTILKISLLQFSFLSFLTQTSLTSHDACELKACWSHDEGKMQARCLTDWLSQETQYRQLSQCQADRHIHRSSWITSRSSWMTSWSYWMTSWSSFIPSWSSCLYDFKIVLDDFLIILDDFWCVFVNLTDRHYDSLSLLFAGKNTLLHRIFLWLKLTFVFCALSLK